MAHGMGSLVTVGAVQQLCWYSADGGSNGTKALKVLSAIKALVLIGPTLKGSPPAYMSNHTPGTNWVLKALRQDSEDVEVIFIPF